MRRKSYSRVSLERLSVRHARVLSTTPMVEFSGSAYRQEKSATLLNEPRDTNREGCETPKVKLFSSSSLFRMALGPDEVRVPKKPVDYVLVYEDDGLTERSHESELRRLFCESLETEELEISEERVGKHVFVKIHSPFERLCKAAEAIRVEAALAGLVIDHEPKKAPGRLKKKLKGILNADDDAYKIYAPFLYKCRDWFIGNHDRATYFRPALRCLMVHYILININIAKIISQDDDMPRKKIGLPYLLMKKAYIDAFILHDASIMEPSSLYSEDNLSRSVELTDCTDDFGDMKVSEELATLRVTQDIRKIMDRTWIGLCKNQPLDMVKDYFGEKIAFYFAWIGSLVTSLWIPSILGVIVFGLGVLEKVTDDSTFWKNNSTSSNSTLSYKDPIYYIELIKASSDSTITPYFALVVCLWGTVQSEVWKRKQITLAHKWHMDTFDSNEPDRPQFQGTRSRLNPVTNELYWYYPMSMRMIKIFASVNVLLLTVCVVFISVTSVIVYRVYSTHKWCAKGDGKCEMVHGAIVPTILNTVSIMILGHVYQYVAIQLTEWENHRTTSRYNDALVIKLFAFQFANTYASLFYIAFFRRELDGNGILGMGKEFTDNCNSGQNDSCMSMLSFQLLSHMIIKPIPKFCKDIIWPQIVKLYRRFRPNRVHAVNDEQSVSKQHFLLREMYKPPVEDFRREELNEKIIQYGYLMMFAASLPIAPMMAQIMMIIDMRVDAKRLLWLNRRPIPYRDNDIGMWLNIIDFVNICGVCSNALLLGFTSDFGRQKEVVSKLLIVIGFEHLVFATKFLLTIIIPDVPTNVANEKRLGQHFVGYLMTKLSSVKANLVTNGQETIKESNDQQNISVATED